MKKLPERFIYQTEKKVYFGWDLRGDRDWRCVVWKRLPRLSSEERYWWPCQDEKPDFCIVVCGNPSDELLTAWLEEEESAATT